MLSSLTLQRRRTYTARWRCRPSFLMGAQHHPTSSSRESPTIPRWRRGRGPAPDGQTGWCSGAYGMAAPAIMLQTDEATAQKFPDAKEVAFPGLNPWKAGVGR